MGLLDADSTKKLYNDLLGRDPDQAGADFWKAGGPQTTEYAQQQIMNSDEYKKRQAQLAQPASGTAPKPATSAVPTATPAAPQPATTGLLDSNAIQSLYQKYLGRNPDQAGADFWQSGGPQTAEYTEQQILNSDEYKNRLLRQQATGAVAATSSGGASAPAQPVNSTPLPGVTSQGYTSTNADAVKALTQGYTAEQVKVDPESTVQGQLAKIADSGSALNIQAATEAAKQANRRGLLNSSMAVGAAQDAVIRASLPVAQQDASTYYNAASTNADRTNSAKAFTANASNTGALQDANLATSVNVTNASEKNKASQFGANAANTAAIATADNTLKLKMADIQANTTLTVAQKQIEAQRAIADANNATNVAISNGDNATKLLLTSMDSASRVTLANMDAASRLTLASLDTDTKFKLANMDAATKTALTNLDAQNKQLLQTNSSAANMYQQYATNLANISNNDKLDGPAKETAIQNQLNALQAGLQAIGETSKLDLSQYFNATISPAAQPAVTPPADVYQPEGT